MEGMVSLGNSHAQETAAVFADCASLCVCVCLRQIGGMPVWHMQ